MTNKRFNRSQINNVIAMHFFAEKGNGEYQLSSRSCDEEWEIHIRIQVNSQNTSTGQGKACYHFKQHASA